MRHIKWTIVNAETGKYENLIEIYGICVILFAAKSKYELQSDSCLNVWIAYNNRFHLEEKKKSKKK